LSVRIQPEINRRPKDLPQFLSLQRSDDAELQDNNEDNTAILAEHFFPLPAKADLSEKLAYSYL
jgi:hypothetical protein